MFNKQNITFLLVLLLAGTCRLFVNAACDNVVGNCTAGCFNPGGNYTFQNGTSHCIPTEAGFYSPADWNEQIPCTIGYISAGEAAECSICPPGTHGHPDRKVCHLCNPGTYQSLPGRTVCINCNPAIYSGEGSTNVTSGGFCFRDSPSPSMAPSEVPSSQPSTMPSAEPTGRPSQQPSESSDAPSHFPSPAPSFAPSEEPSPAPSFAPSEEPSPAPSFSPSEEPTFTASVPLEIDEGVCGADEHAFHGLCAHCPKLFQYVFFPLLGVAIGVAMGLYFFLTAPQGTPTLFVLVEFMQKLYLIGTALVPWPAALKWMFQVCGIFAVDLELLLPPQCILGMDKQASKVLLGMVPFLSLAIGAACIKAWTSYRQIPFRPAMKRFFGATMILFCFFYMTLVRASLEAIQCSPVYNNDSSGDATVDWMCMQTGSTGDKVIAYFSIFTGVIYGFGYPVALWRLVKIHKEAVHKEKVADSASQTDVESQQGQVAALREQATRTEPNPLKDALRPFITLFTEQRWYWALLLLVHKLLSVVFVVFAGENVILSLALLLVVELFVGSFALFESPFGQDFEGDIEAESQRSFKLRTYQVLDTVLRFISIAIIVLGVVLRFMDADSESRVLVGILGVALPVGGIVYVFALAMKSIKERNDSEMAKVGSVHNGDSTTTVVRRKTEQVEVEADS